MTSPAELAERTFRYFERERNADTGLVRDNTQHGAPASIAASGFALSCYIVAAERGYLERAVAAERVLTILRFFHRARQDDSASATGYRGFFYHFLDFDTGRRKWKSELSTVDSAIFLAGALAVRSFFNLPGELEIRDLAEKLYRAADWPWMLSRNLALSHGWKPERGFLRYEWRGYNEALLLHILAVGSPTHPISSASYAEWTSTYRWKTLYGHGFVYGGPLFMHQLPHAWIDFRGIRDAYMRARRIDYFENSRRATYIQREYAIRNPRGFVGYGENAWGITASNGPGPARSTVNGRQRAFHGYRARGVPYGWDDGTLAPWAMAASLPFAPEIVLPALASLSRAYPAIDSAEGYKCSFNPSFPGSPSGGWVGRTHFAIEQGPVVLMIENYRSGLLWKLARECPYIAAGLKGAGFTGGWLEG